MYDSSFGGRETAPASKMQLLWPSWFGVFRISSGPLCGCGEECRGCGSVSKESTYLFFIFVTLGNRKESSKTLDITASVCQSHASFSRYRAFAVSELSRSISCLAMQRVMGLGWGPPTYVGRGDACLSAAARRRMDTRRCMLLRGTGMRRWWTSFWRRGWSRM